MKKVLILILQPSKLEIWKVNSNVKVNTKGRVGLCLYHSKAHPKPALHCFPESLPEENKSRRSYMGWASVDVLIICSVPLQVPCCELLATWALRWSDQIILLSLPGTMSSSWCIPLKGTLASLASEPPWTCLFHLCEGPETSTHGTLGPRMWLKTLPS